MSEIETRNLPSTAERSPDERTDFGYRRVPTKEKAGYVRRHFNSIADRYDFMNSLLSLGLHHLWKRWAIRTCGLKTGDRMMDVCGGTGDLSRLAAKAIGPQGRVILYDINRAMIEAGRPKMNRIVLASRVRYIQGDAERISCCPGCMDAALVGFGIRNLTRMERGLEEMFRILKPGGKIMVLEFSLPTSAVFRWLYDFYSFHLMPLMGKIFAGTEEAYLYLPESIRRFPQPVELSRILREIGFARVAYCRLTNGIAVIYTGVKL
jgi:demethylmenaquinone methyltransferase/2-methoxy-6-polyprenyl-1,4-benzoquinol methylase